MEYLKKLMGSAWHEGITLEEINTFLSQGKYVNLNDGNYVDKDKYNKVVSERDANKTKLDELTEKTKDYDTLKTENDTYKAEKADNNLKEKLVKLGVSEKAFKYVKGDINDKTLVIGDDDKVNKDAVAKYLKENPQFAAQGANGPRRIITTKVDSNEDHQQQEDAHKIVNQNLREAFGKKVNVGNE